MGEPPFEAGGVKLTVACWLPGAAEPMTGAPGTSAPIVRERVALVKLAGPEPVLESVPETVNVKVPPAVGTPEMVPAAESERPVGRAPLARTAEKR